MELLLIIALGERNLSNKYLSWWKTLRKNTFDEETFKKIIIDEVISSINYCRSQQILN